MSDNDPDTLLAAPPIQVATQFCLCGHQHNEHRLDLQTPRCDRPACGCKTFRLGRTLYRECRWTE